MKFIKDIFSASSTVSSMRIMSMMCCTAAIVIAIIGLTKNPIDYSGLSLLSATFLGAAFGGKVAQKHIESKA